MNMALELARRSHRRPSDVSWDLYSTTQKARGSLSLRFARSLAICTESRGCYFTTESDSCSAWLFHSQSQPSPPVCAAPTHPLPWL